MDVTVSGIVKIKANEDVYDRISQYIEEEFDEDDELGEKYSTYFYDGETEIEDEMIITLEQSEEFLKTTDYNKDIIEFMQGLIQDISDITEASFVGCYESWGSGEFIKFECVYNGVSISIKNSETFEDADEANEAEAEKECYCITLQ